MEEERDEQTGVASYTRDKSINKALKQRSRECMVC